MRRDMNEDKFLYDVSEESILKDWNTGNGVPDHEFSEEYKNFRQEMICKAGNSDAAEEKEMTEIIPINSKTKKRRFFKTPVGVAAALAAVLALSAGAYAISGIFTIKSKDRTDESYGELSYTVEAQEGVSVTPMKLVMDYLPEGYVETENGGNKETLRKFHKADNASGLTVGISDYSYQISLPFVSEIEETEIGGVKADILTRDGVDYKHIILMFYEELGQIVTMYGYEDISVDELKKVAENIKLEPTGEAAYVPDVNIKAAKDEDASVEGPDRSVQDDQIVAWGEPVEMMRGLTFTVKNIELRDNLDGLDETYLFDSAEDLAGHLNEDGTFKNVELGYEAWENNAMAEKRMGTGHVRLAYITLDVTNTSDEDLMDEFVYGRIGAIDEDGEFNIMGEYRSVLDGWGELAGAEPIYYDGADYLDGEYNKHVFNSDFKAGETRTVHLAIPYVQEIEENAYLMFRDWIGHLTPVYVKLVP